MEREELCQYHPVPVGVVVGNIVVGVRAPSVVASLGDIVSPGNGENLHSFHDEYYRHSKII